MPEGYEDLLRRNRYLLDLSALIDLPDLARVPGLTLIVSAPLDAVMSSESGPDRDELVRRVGGFPAANAWRVLGDVSTQDQEAPMLLGYPREEDWTAAYQHMKAAGRIEVLADEELDPELARALDGLTRERDTTLP